MFVKPRVKKSILPPPHKKRKSTSDVEEIAFDQDARTEFLTGFHKRKQQRIKNAQEVAAKRAKQEKIDTRRQVRQDRKREIEEHVERVNQMLQESNAASASMENDLAESNEDLEEWGGFPDRPDLDMVDHEEEYIDEDRFTTVTVESVSVTRDGLSKPALPVDDEEAVEVSVDPKHNTEEQQAGAQGIQKRLPKKKKKQFRYESKLERNIENVKQKARNRAKRG